MGRYIGILVIIGLIGYAGLLTYSTLKNESEPVVVEEPLDLEPVPIATPSSSQGLVVTDLYTSEEAAVAAIEEQRQLREFTALLAEEDGYEAADVPSGSFVGMFDRIAGQALPSTPDAPEAAEETFPVEDPLDAVLQTADA
ncbi:MAG: hypothetical protein O3A46_01365, partial [Candidatus Poribacteria bacterium]|nr:hypothetical protein [Candidatus Poribacteria bacterium]